VPRQIEAGERFYASERENQTRGSSTRFQKMPARAGSGQ
jgi:hypothetical protein